MAPSRDRRPGFSRRAQYGLFVTYVLGIAGALVGAALLALSAFNPAGFAAVRAGVAEVTTPVSSAMAWVARGIVAVPEAIGTWIDVHGDNARLQARVDRSAGALMAGRAAMLENARLRRLLGFRERDATTVAVARIVSTTASSTRRFGLLNAGRWQGVEEGQPVRGPEGLIGRVLEAGPNAARVLLLTDAESVVPVRRLRDGRAALAAGRGDGLVDIRTIDTADGQFRVGDVYVTTGVGGIYTPGVPVAQGIAKGTDTAPARPFAAPDALDVAMVSRQYFAPPPPAPAPSPVPAPLPSPAPSPTAAAR